MKLNKLVLLVDRQGTSASGASHVLCQEPAARGAEPPAHLGADNFIAWAWLLIGESLKKHLLEVAA
jgi:hypothetical protein